MLTVDFNESKGVNFARYMVKPGEYLFIAEGFAMRAHGRWFRNRGYVRVQGVLAIGVR